MRKFFLLLVAGFFSLSVFAQPGPTTKEIQAQKDSTLRALIHKDSLKVEAEYAEKENMGKLMSKFQFPLIKATDFSGIVMVKNPDEIPDPNQDYKLLFELTYNNPDSLSKEVNGGLVEIARVINLHVASGIPVKRIMPVIVVHGMPLEAIGSNETYRKKHQVDNPNISLIKDLENLAGARFIACGQAMAFFGYKKEDMYPDVKISLTAQTVLSNYQLKGYVLYKINDVK